MIEQPPIREVAPSPEAKPSLALALRLYHGKFDTDQPITNDSQGDSFASALTALHNQNISKRKDDEAKFAARFPKQYTAEELRDVQMQVWTAGVMDELGHDVRSKGRGDRTAAILQDKLGMTKLTGNGDQDKVILQKYLYDANTKTEGDFYKNFCTGNMNEALIKAKLTVDDMMHLRTFLTKWMLGSDEAFTALVALRHSMDMLGSKDNAAAMQANLVDQLPDRDRNVLRFFRDGLVMKPDDEKKKSSVQQQAGATQEEPNQSSRIAETEKEELPPIRVGMSEDPNTTYRPTMEDAHVIERELGGNPDRGFYAIYDGHGGREVADVAAKSLHQNLIIILNTDRLSPTNALRAAYNLTDGSMQQANILGGATALTVLTEGDKIYVANLGDARAVLIHEGDKAERLSTDRKALDPQEQARVRERGGEIYTKRDEQGKIIDVRVVGKTLPDGNTEMLAVSAALGDFDYPGIQREPDIQEITRQASDKWLILACDGVWDVIHDADVAGIIGTESDPQKASDLLVQAALERGSKDNVSVIALQLQP